MESALQRKEEKIENLWSSAHVVHTRGKQVISCRRKDENGCEMYKNEKMHVQSLLNYCFSLLNMEICDFLVMVGEMVPYHGGREGLKTNKKENTN